VTLSFLSGDSLFIIFLAVSAIAPADSLLCITPLPPEYLCPFSHTRAKHSKTTVPDRPQHIQPRHAEFVVVGTKSKKFASVSSYLKYMFIARKFHFTFHMPCFYLFNDTRFPSKMTYLSVNGEFLGMLMQVVRIKVSINMHHTLDNSKFLTQSAYISTRFDICHHCQGIHLVS
jgi:hypothetical protein